MATTRINNGGRRIWPTVTYGGLPVEGDYIREAEERLLLSEPNEGKYKLLTPFEARKRQDAYTAGLLFKILRLVGTKGENEPKSSTEREMLRVASRVTIPLPYQYWTELGGEVAMYRYGNADAGLKLSACDAIRGSIERGLGGRGTFWVSRTNGLVVAAWGTPLEGEWLDAAVSALSADVKDLASLCR